MKSHALPLIWALGLGLAASPALAQESVSKVNGSINAESGQRYGRLNTVNGGIQVDDGVETGKIETVNGSIRIGAGARTGAISTVNGAVRLADNVTAEGNVETVNGSIFSDRHSHLRGTVSTVNGGIGLVDTQLTGDIETVNGDITVGVGSTVSGGIRVRKPNFNLSLTPGRKPRVIIGPNAVVEGTLDFEREVVLQVHRTAKIGTVHGATAEPFDTDTAPDN